MKGRKPIYKPEDLEIGEKLPILGSKRRFAHQYAYNFNRRLKDRKFRAVNDGVKWFIERIA
jgi:hypothetical protein